MLPRVNILRCGDVDYMTLSTRDAITNSLHVHGEYASVERAITLRLLDGVKAPLVLDVGANLGTFAIPIAKQVLTEDGLVFCFEAQRIVFYQLCGNIFLNRLDNVHAFHCAIGSGDGQTTLPGLDYERSINVGGFSMSKSFREKTGNVQENGTAYAVDLRRLDSIKFPKSPDLIKIDVEGYELDVLKGAETLLKESVYPPLLLEAWGLEWFSEQRDELRRFLSELGYQIFSYGDEMVAQHPQHHRHFSFISEGSGHFRMQRTR